MNLKVLFREYDYPNNVISCGAENNELIGAGTKFTEQLTISARVEIEVSPGVCEFIGCIDEIVDDTHAILDREHATGFNNKAFWLDWSLFKISASDITRGVESENPGEAGAVVFDNVSLSFYFEDYISIGGLVRYNPVYKAFQGSLDDKKRFLIRLQGTRLNGGLEEAKTVFEGMIDFSTIEYPDVKNDDGELIQTITFDVLDKLSALSILTNTNNQRSALVNACGRLPGGRTSADTGFVYIYDDTNLLGLGPKIIIMSFEKTTVDNAARPGNAINHTSVILQKGETLQHPVRIGNSTEHFIVTDSGLGTFAANTFRRTPFVYYDAAITYTWVKIAGSIPGMFLMSSALANLNFINKAWVPGAGSGDYSDPWSNSIPGCNYYTNNYYTNANILLQQNDAYSRTVVYAFNAVKILEEIIKQAWPDYTIVLKPDTIEFGLPLDYANEMISNLPFEKEPLDALTSILNSMLCWGYFDRFGRFNIYKKDVFAGTERTINLDYAETITKRYFWDKIADAVEIKVQGWALVDYIETSTVLQRNPDTKPRNQISKTIIIDKDSLSEFGITISSNGLLTDPEVPSGNQEEILIHYATLVAQKYLAFYGKRHTCYEMELCKLDWDMLDWDMLDIYPYNSENYFVTNMSFNVEEESMQLTLPSQTGYEYNAENILIPNKTDSYTSGTSGSSSSSGGGNLIILEERNIGYV